MEGLKLRLFKAQESLRHAVEDLDKKQKELDLIKSEITDKPHLAMEVSDHAIVQYQRRALKIAVGDHINQILNLCDTSGEPEEQNRNGDGIQYIYNADGPNNTEIKLVVKNNKVVTCYVNEKTV